MSSSLTPKQQDEVLLLSAAGLGARSIADKIGSTRGRVRWFLDHISASREQPADNESAKVGAFRAVVYDLETTRFSSDLGKLVAAAFLDVTTGHVVWRNIDSFQGDVVDRERQLARWAYDQYVAADMLIGHNIVAFDKCFLNGVLARHGLTRLPKRIQADTFLIARYGFKGLVHSYSLENLADFFRCEDGKDKPSIHDWRESSMDLGESVERITQRCLRDVRVNYQVWEHLKPFFYEWRGQ